MLQIERVQEKNGKHNWMQNLGIQVKKLEKVSKTWDLDTLEDLTVSSVFFHEQSIRLIEDVS